MKPLKMNYAKAIRMMRAARDLGQGDLAKALGVDPSFISLIETNRRSPSLETMGAIAGVFRVPMFLIFLLADENLPRSEVRRLGGDIAALILDRQ